MKTIFAAAAMILSLATSVSAATINGFTLDYAVPNWTLTSAVGGGVDTAAAPNAITLIEPNSGSGGTLSYTIEVAETGTISFDYVFGGTDFGWGSAGALLNGAQTTLPGATRLNSSPGQTFSAFFNVNAGDTFGFFSNSVDGIFGSTTLNVSNFQAVGVAAVPLPASLLLLLTALGGLMLRRRAVTT